jgi:hypothetical protein
MDIWVPPAAEVLVIDPLKVKSVKDAKKAHLSNVFKQPGGRDLMAYLIRSITTLYSSRTAHVEQLGTPWEKLIFSQGLLHLICELFLTLCSVDSNLFDVESIGGQRALLMLSRYAEDRRVRRTSTELLTRLAVKLCNVTSKNTMSK